MLQYIIGLFLLFKSSFSSHENYENLNNLIKDQFQQFKSLNTPFHDDEILEIYKRKSNSSSSKNDSVGNLDVATNLKTKGTSREGTSDREVEESLIPRTEVEITSLNLTKEKVERFSVRPSNNMRCSKSRVTQCGVVCHCYGGREYCCRQRKDWDSLTPTEKRRYVRLVLTIANGQRGRALQREYRDLLLIHQRHWYAGIHNRQLFLPWHRMYLLAFENLLRKANCRVTVPYWDWTKEPKIWYEHNVFSRNFFGSNSGGRGDMCTRTGVFTSDAFRDLRDNCLVRNFSYNIRPATYSRIQNILGYREFKRFESGLRLEHGIPHFIVGGEGRGLFFNQRAAEDPLFFVHHSSVDYQWYQRQARYTTDRNKLYKEYWGNQKNRSARLIGLGSRVEDVVNPFKHNGVCVEYVEGDENRYKDYINRPRASQLNNRCDANVVVFPRPIFTLFNITPLEQREFKRDRQQVC